MFGTTREEKEMKLTPARTLMFALFQSFIWRTQILKFIFIRTTWCILSWNSLALTLKETFLKVLELFSYSDNKGRRQSVEALMANKVFSFRKECGRVMINSFHVSFIQCDSCPKCRKRKQKFPLFILLYHDYWISSLRRIQRLSLFWEGKNTIWDTTQDRNKQRPLNNNSNSCNVDLSLLAFAKTYFTSVSLHLLDCNIHYALGLLFQYVNNQPTITMCRSSGRLIWLCKKSYLAIGSVPYLSGLVKALKKWFGSPVSMFTRQGCALIN